MKLSCHRISGDGRLHGYAFCGPPMFPMDSDSASAGHFPLFDFGSNDYCDSIFSKPINNENQDEDENQYAF